MTGQSLLIIRRSIARNARFARELIANVGSLEFSFMYLDIFFVFKLTYIKTIQLLKNDYRRPNTFAILRDILKYVNYPP